MFRVMGKMKKQGRAGQGKGGREGRCFVFVGTRGKGCDVAVSGGRVNRCEPCEP